MNENTLVLDLREPEGKLAAMVYAHAKPDPDLYEHLHQMPGAYPYVSAGPLTNPRADPADSYTALLAILGIDPSPYTELIEKITTSDKAHPFMWILHDTYGQRTNNGQKEETHD